MIYVEIPSVERAQNKVLQVAALARLMIARYQTADAEDMSDTGEWDTLFSNLLTMGNMLDDAEKDLSQTITQAYISPHDLPENTFSFRE